uniref:Nuclear pore protein n=1 Tax=Acrobeloides nanus TaxID=290746 RepID=A0A914BVH6_9BILA
MASMFDDILQRAEKLTNSTQLRASTFFPRGSLTTVNVAQLDRSTLLDANLADIFRTSEEMCQRKQLRDELIHHDQQLITQPIKPQTSWKKPTISRAEDYNSQLPSSSYNITSGSVLEDFVEDSIERSRVEAERAFLNQQILEATQLAPLHEKSVHASSGDFDRLQLTGGAPIARTFQPLQLLQDVFARKIDEHLTKNCQANILPALKSAFLEVEESRTKQIWEQVFAICVKPLLDETESINEFRASQAWMNHILDNSTKYLHTMFRNHVEALIEANREQARRGGVPGTITLVEAYLNVKRLRINAQDGNFGNHPIWMVIFHCLRLGDFEAAATVAKQLQNLPHCSVLITIILNLAKNILINQDMRIKLNAEWKHESKGTKDYFKKAVYGLLLSFDCPEVNDSIENWLWARLMACKLDQHQQLNRFHQLQRTICVDFGEEYFMGGDGDCLVYFSALWLTGQVERAIDLLFRLETPVHAAHISIIAYQFRMLVLSETVSAPILSADSNEPTICRLNFARIILLYVKEFELKNICYALNYCFFLNKLEFDDHDGIPGGNFFEACVSRLVYLTGEVDSILGSLTSNGEHLPGYIDKFSAVVNIPDIISRVAFDTNINGDTLQACRLYCLADRPNDAIKLICRHLSMCVTSINDRTSDAVKMSEWLAKSYKGITNVESQHLSTMFLLLDLYTLFRLFNEPNYEATLSVAERLQVIPLDPNQVQSSVSNFHMVPDQVRAILPDICVCLMKAIVEVFKHSLPSSPTRAQMQNYARAIVLYTAMIPYRFPTHINSQLLQLQTQLH